jgi:hypothetical protein
MEYADYRLTIANDLMITGSCLNTSETDQFKIDKKDIEYANQQLENEKIDVDRAFIKNVGTVLANSLFTPKIKRHFGRVRSKNGNKGLRVRLTIESPEVSAYPWEALFLDNKYLAVSVETPLTRFFPNATTTNKNFGKPLKILFIGSNPSATGITGVPVNREIQAIKDSLTEENENGVIEFDPEPVGDIDNIMEHLENEQYNVIHFLGHGAFKDGVGYLALENENGGLEFADHERVGQIFQNQHSIGLFVLNACQGAQMSTDKAFTGLASELLKMGVPSVIAMRYSIATPTARLFSKEFYKNLVKMPIDENLQRVRHRILVDANTNPRDFMIPVLFMNALNGLILSPEDAAARELAQSPAYATRIEELKRAWDDFVGVSSTVDEKDLWLMIWDIYKNHEESLDVKVKREIKSMVSRVPVLLQEKNKALLSGFNEEARRMGNAIMLNYETLMDIIKRRIN